LTGGKYRLKNTNQVPLFQEWSGAHLASLNQPGRHISRNRSRKIAKQSTTQQLEHNLKQKEFS